MKLFCTIVISVLLFSCKKGNTVYYPDGKVWKQYYMEDSLINGEYKEYYPNGNIGIIRHYHKGGIDSSIYYSEQYQNRIDAIEYPIIGDTTRIVVFDDEGRIDQEGLSIDERRIGDWKVYDEGELIAILDYLTIKGDEYLNQVWQIDDLDTLYYGSYYFEILTKDFYKRNEEFKAFAVLNIEWFKDQDSEIELTIAADESEVDFNEDFSNEEEVIKKTFYNLSKDVVNQPWLDMDGNIKHGLAFGRKIGNLNNDVIRGYITEFYEHLERDSLYRKERRFYFNKPITRVD